MPIEILLYSNLALRIPFDVAHTAHSTLFNPVLSEIELSFVGRFGGKIQLALFSLRFLIGYLYKVGAVAALASSFSGFHNDDIDHNR